ncbi:MAG TPA: hypothetical protein VIL82_08060 [Solirubrobacteraceae bacterium]
MAPALQLDQLRHRRFVPGAVDDLRLSFLLLESAPPGPHDRPMFSLHRPLEVVGLGPSLQEGALEALKPQRAQPGCFGCPADRPVDRAIFDKPLEGGEVRPATAGHAAEERRGGVVRVNARDQRGADKRWQRGRSTPYGRVR